MIVTMKKFILYCFLSLFMATASIAQEQRPMAAREQREQKIEALYIAFMTRELSLTEEEAQKFWPVHSQFDTELRGVSLETPELERQQQILNIKKRYQDRFTKILGASRTNDFYVKDTEFRKKLVDRLRKMRQGGDPNNRRNNMKP